MGGADYGPFGAHFRYAPQQELAEAASLFDLSEHRFHHLLSHPVGCFEAIGSTGLRPRRGTGSEISVAICVAGRGRRY